VARHPNASRSRSSAARSAILLVEGIAQAVADEVEADQMFGRPAVNPSFVEVD
jgi:hypothetical protein